MTSWLIGCLIVAALALIVDRLVGYPDWLYGLIRHPVVWIGKLIAVLDARLNHNEDSFVSRKRAGVVALCTVLAVALLATVPLTLVLRGLPGGLIVEGVLAASLIAWRSLSQHVASVADALDLSLTEGRDAVRHIVGRNPEALDEQGVAVAAVESLAENYSDGVVAPLIWLVIGGLPGIALYKAINTADSMIGYRSERHLAFGWASAQLDDLVNLPGSRLSAWLFIAAATFRPDTSPARARRAVQRDAANHVSPNAGWPEAALAGALRMTLGGTRSYGDRKVDLATMGEGPPPAGAGDIRRALHLCRTATDVLSISLLAGLALAVILAALRAVSG
ncbi:MAG: adenosylcobinamide-phosphate synthase CbiB [Pseudomonadota bacterium]